LRFFWQKKNVVENNIQNKGPVAMYYIYVLSEETEGELGFVHVCMNIVIS